MLAKGLGVGVRGEEGLERGWGGGLNGALPFTDTTP